MFAYGPPCWTLLLHLVLVYSAGDQLSVEVTIMPHPGDNVILPCQAPGKGSIRAAEWSRPDLQTQYVFFYRDGQADNTRQHPNYHYRVKLADSELKDGDLSLMLKNVELNDTGTYECRVKQEDTKRMRRAVIKSEPISIVTVIVKSVHTVGSSAVGPSGAGGHLVGHVGLVVGLVMMAVI